ncbi:MAG TPA: hypothetical protein VHL59_10025 [Thermoanaerobaculia bacterium]|nr:hypothetical protein [Thermoanaerobaculia bacterium]
MGRKVGAVLLGTIVAFLVIAAVQMVSAIFYPVPEGLMKDKAAMAAHIARLPVTAFLFVLAAYALGTVAGVATATRVGRSVVPGYIVGALLLIATLVNLTMFPHPAWFWVASIAVVAGATFGMTRTAPPAVAQAA